MKAKDLKILRKRLAKLQKAETVEQLQKAVLGNEKDWSVVKKTDGDDEDAQRHPARPHAPDGRPRKREVDVSIIL